MASQAINEQMSDVTENPLRTALDHITFELLNNALESYSNSDVKLTENFI